MHTQAMKRQAETQTEQSQDRQRSSLPGDSMARVPGPAMRWRTLTVTALPMLQQPLPHGPVTHLRWVSWPFLMDDNYAIATVRSKEQSARPDV